MRARGREGIQIRAPGLKAGFFFWPLLCSSVGKRPAAQQQGGFRLGHCGPAEGASTK